MDEGRHIQIAAAQRHIIERPRLTKLLDESTSRVILLVAPAGYGKTTLARQWMATRTPPFAWYDCGLEASDAAGFAIGLARAVRELCPRAPGAIRTFLTTLSGAPNLRALSDIIIDAFSDWPPGHWLVVDDYHVSSDARTGASFARALAESTDVCLMIAARSRPVWISARSMLYGVVTELNQAQLTMSEQEAHEILGGLGPAATARVRDWAGGWPAVLGLAALTKAQLDTDNPPAELHAFLAEELYESLTTGTKRGLTVLSVAPQISHGLADYLLGDSSDNAIAEGISSGFLSAPEESKLVMHPLLRSFLSSKLNQQSDADARRVAEYLLESRQWDDAYSVIATHRLHDLLARLLRAATTDLLHTGRGASLSSWLEHARRNGVTDPFLWVAASELAFQEGSYKESGRLAEAAIKEFAVTDPLVWRAWFNRAKSAYFSEEVDGALEYYARAGELAEQPADKQEALWGALCCANYGARSQADDLVAQFAALRDDSPEFQLRLATARVTNATNFGGLDDALDSARGAEPFLHATDDAMIRSAFLYGWISALTLNARYEEAEAVLVQSEAEARSSRLLFAIDLVDCQRAAVEIGKGRYARASALVQRVEAAASRREDLYLLLVALTHRARIGALGMNPQLVRVPHISVVETGAYSEYLSGVALLRVAQGEAAAALRLTNEIDTMTSTVEAAVHAAFIRAIVALNAHEERARLLTRHAFERVMETGLLDAFVYAYRLCDAILEAVLSDGAPVEVVASVLDRAGDRDLARRFNLLRPQDYARATQLTPREEEVLRLVARGHTNGEIAKILFITPVTVKVHLRHVYEKLGVRSRTEAALRAQAQNLI